MSFRGVTGIDDAMAAALRDLDDRLTRLENGGAIKGLVSFDPVIRIGDVLVTTAAGAGDERTLTFTNAITGAVITAEGGTSKLLAYAFKDSDTSVTATTEAAADEIVTAGAIDLDGATPILIEFSAPGWNNNSDSATLTLVLYGGLDGATPTSLGILEQGFGATTAEDYMLAQAAWRPTPAAGSWVFSVRAYTAGTAQPAIIRGGAAGSPTLFVPAFVRVTRDD